MAFTFYIYICILAPGSSADGSHRSHTIKVSQQFSYLAYATTCASYGGPSSANRTSLSPRRSHFPVEGRQAERQLRREAALILPPESRSLILSSRTSSCLHVQRKMQTRLFAMSRMTQRNRTLDRVCPEQPWPGSQAASVPVAGTTNRIAALLSPEAPWLIQHPSH